MCKFLGLYLQRRGGKGSVEGASGAERVKHTESGGKIAEQKIREVERKRKCTGRRKKTLTCNKVFCF